MNNSRVDSDRVVLAATLLTGFIGLACYAVLYLTVMQYGQLNTSGRAFSWLALILTAATLLMSIYLALAARSRALASSALSGVGWFIVAAGLVLAFPALGGTIGLLHAQGLSTFNGVAGALFLIMAGAGLLQAERTAREHSADNA